MTLATVVTTYAPAGDVGIQRCHVTRQAIGSWARCMDGTGAIRLVMVDDGSAPEYKLTDYGGAFIETPRLGCGGALSIGMRHVFDNDLGDVVFYAQDDWELTEPLDLAPSLALLNSGTADIVRLGPTHPGLVGHVERTDIPGAEWCLEYDWAGGGYVVGWRPALYHRRIFERFPLDGLEGLSAIEGERVWLERMAADPNPPRVFHAPNCTLAGPFRHIDTVELGEDDPATLTARYE